MHEQPVHLVDAHARVVQRLLQHLRHLAGGKLVNLLAHHGDGLVRPTGDRSDGCELARLARIPEIQVIASSAIGMHLEAKHTGLAVGGLDDHSSRAVPKEHACVAVRPVHPARESVRANDDSRLVRAGVQELSGGVDAE
eukprot:scaffold28323_cov112-Isochrysis_galbana.AAC.3